MTSQRTGAVDAEPESVQNRVAGQRPESIAWGADLLGFAVAMFFSLLFLAIIGAVLGAAGFQFGTVAQRVGGSTSVQLGIAVLIASIVAVFVAYIIGGYAAGRMARYDGIWNGVGVVIWTVIAAILLAVAGAAAGARFALVTQLHLGINGATLTTAGIISLLVTLLAMLAGAILGGWLADRTAPVPLYTLPASAVELGNEPRVRDLGDVVEVPIVEEVMVKQPIVREVLRVRKTAETQSETVTGDLRTEDVEVSTEGRTGDPAKPTTSQRGSP